MKIGEAMVSDLEVPQGWAGHGAMVHPTTHYGGLLVRNEATGVYAMLTNRRGPQELQSVPQPWARKMSCRTPDKDGLLR